MAMSPEPAQPQSPPWDSPKMVSLQFGITFSAVLGSPLWTRVLFNVYFANLDDFQINC